MTKIAFDLRVGDVIEAFGNPLTITGIKGVYFPNEGVMLRFDFARGGFVPRGYTTLKRVFNVVGHV